MRSYSMLFISHLLGFIVILFGLWWLAGNIPALPDYKLVVASVAVAGLVLNHFRWWGLSRKVDDLDLLGQVNFLVVSNYMVMILLFVLSDFRR